jgi:hypothetical protein
MSLKDVGPSHLPLLVSLHPVDGMDDLERSGVAWGTLIDPGLALLSTTASEDVTSSWPGALRLLAAAAKPDSGALLDAPVSEVLRLAGREDHTHLVVRAELGDWQCSGLEVWQPGRDHRFDDRAAALADRILARCEPPAPTWFEFAAKARAGFGPAPRPYPFAFGRLPGVPQPEPGFSALHAAGRRRPTWTDLLRRWLERDG